jgi:hypothetical protein
LSSRMPIRFSRVPMRLHCTKCSHDGSRSDNRQGTCGA